MKNKEPQSPEESLALIQAMIDKAKNSYIESGIGPLSWGILISFCSLVTYSRIVWGFNIGFDVWLLTMVAFIPQGYFSWRAGKNKNCKSFEENVLNWVWGAFGATILLLIVYNLKFHPPKTSSLFLLLYGVPSFITGGITKTKSMLIGGIICWVCFILSLYSSSANTMLLTTLSAVSAWLIPGIILRKRYLKLKNV